MSEPKPIGILHGPIDTLHEHSEATPPNGALFMSLWSSFGGTWGLLRRRWDVPEGPSSLRRNPLPGAAAGATREAGIRRLQMVRGGYGVT